MICAALGFLLGILDQDQGRLRQFEESHRGHHDKDRPGREEGVRQQEEDYRSGQEPPYSFRGPGEDSRALESLGEILFYPALDHGLRFAPYPYSDEIPAEWGSRSWNYFLGTRQSEREVAFDLEPYWIRIDQDLLGYGIRGGARFSSGSDFHFDIVQYAEQVGDRTDLLTLQEYQLNYGPGRGPRNYQWTLGWGLSSLDGAESRLGFSLQAAVEWFPMDPISLRVEADYIIFSTSRLNDLQGEIRLHVDRVALTLGVRSLGNSRGDRLTGPLAGVTVWF